MNKKYINKINLLNKFLLDLIFPIYCVGCSKEGKWICSDCRKKIILIRKVTCPICKRISSKGKVCPRCRSKTVLTGLIVAAYYDDKILKEAIHTLKYEYCHSLANDLAEFLVFALRETKINGVLVPVPLHKRRQNQRGFNQSEILAKSVGKKLNLEMIKNKLIRSRATKAQIELSGLKRKQNLKNAFQWKGNAEIVNKKVILVDDVYTTGTTIEECAGVLKKAGAREVWGLVLVKV